MIARVEASARRGELSALYYIEAVATLRLAVLLWNFWLPAVLLLVAARRHRRARGQRPAARRGGAGGREHVESGVGELASAGSLPHRARSRAKGQRGSEHRVLGDLRARPGDRGRARRRRRCIGRAVHRRRLVPDLRADAARSAPPRRGSRRRLGARAAAGRLAVHPLGARSARRCCSPEAVALVFFESAAPIEVAYAKMTLHAGDRGYGLLLGAWGVGVVARQPRLRAQPERSLKVLLSAGTLGGGAAPTSASRSRPRSLLACIGGACRRARQRRSVGLADQRRAAPLPTAPAGPHDGRGRIALGRLPGARAGARRRARGAQLAPYGLPGGRHRGRGHDRWDSCAFALQVERRCRPSAGVGAPSLGERIGRASG